MFAHNNNNVALTVSHCNVNKGELVSKFVPLSSLDMVILPVRCDSEIFSTRYITTLTLIAFAYVRGVRKLSKYIVSWAKFSQRREEAISMACKVNQWQQPNG